jgi:hypothetical protein
MKIQGSVFALLSLISMTIYSQDTNIKQFNLENMKQSIAAYENVPAGKGWKKLAVAHKISVEVMQFLDYKWRDLDYSARDEKFMQCPDRAICGKILANLRRGNEYLEVALISYDGTFARVASALLRAAVTPLMSGEFATLYPELVKACELAALYRGEAQNEIMCNTINC